MADIKTKKENTSEITFHNEPKLSEHEIQGKFNKRRISLVPHVRDFISTHERFENKEVSVTFAHKGVSSLISIIEADNEKVVLKIPLSSSHSGGEAQFLKVWEHARIKVPHVIEEGMLGGYAYTLMQHIDAPTLGEVYGDEELLEKGIYFQMGRVLAAMHAPRATGYGKVIDGKAEFAEFKDWINSEDMQKRYQYVAENMLLGKEHGSLAAAIAILTEHANIENQSSYCHDDFGTSNAFATDPVTVFDPNPRFNNRYIDLGRSVFKPIAYNGVFPEQLIDGYFEGKSYDKKVLHASVIISSYYKFPYAHKTKNLKLIQNIREYLIKNKDLLE